jgi:glycosyltransferase involved in cell wall biosynthesis
MLKILSLNNYHYVRGGSERYFLDHKSLLEKHGHEVITFSTRHRRNEHVGSRSVLVSPLDLSEPTLKSIGRFIYSRQNRLRLRELLSITGPDLAHLHIYYGQLTAAVLRPLKLSQIPVVQTLHEYRLYCPVSTLYRNGILCQDCAGKTFWRAVVGRCNRNSLPRSLVSSLETYISHFLGAESAVDKFLTVSDFQRRKMIELGLPENKIVTVHNFKDVSNIRPTSDPGRHFLYFGRLERVKGISTLIDAAADIKDVPLFIAGDGQARPTLERMVEKKGINHIVFTGFQSGDALEELIRNSICTVLPSEWWETFGLTTLESFAMGRPVIASDIGGIPEVITHGRDGILVQPGCVDELRQQLEWMSTHRNKAVEMGMEGRGTVERRFDPVTHYQKLFGLYRELKRSAPRA